MQSESELERKPEVPASTCHEALFHCAEPSGKPLSLGYFVIAALGNKHSPGGKGDTEDDPVNKPRPNSTDPLWRKMVLKCAEDPVSSSAIQKGAELNCCEETTLCLGAWLFNRFE